MLREIYCAFSLKYFVIFVTGVDFALCLTSLIGCIIEIEIEIGCSLSMLQGELNSPSVTKSLKQDKNSKKT